MGQHILHNAEEMHQLGMELAKAHQYLLLNGELGAGKTTLAKGFAAGLGIDHQQVKSPTYTYIQVYDDKLLHIDMRRIHDTETAREIGLRDLIDSYDYILVERPKFTSEWASTNWLQVHIQKLPDDRRLVETR